MTKYPQIRRPRMTKDQIKELDSKVMAAVKKMTGLDKSITARDVKNFLSDFGDKYTIHQVCRSLDRFVNDQVLTKTKKKRYDSKAIRSRAFGGVVALVRHYYLYELKENK